MKGLLLSPLLLMQLKINQKPRKEEEGRFLAAAVEISLVHL